MDAYFLLHKLKLPKVILLYDLLTCPLKMAVGLANRHGMGAPGYVPPAALLLQPALVFWAQVPSRTHAGVHTLPGHCQDKAPAWCYLGPHG
jgi:hypothetical protein